MAMRVKQYGAVLMCGATALAMLAGCGPELVANEGAGPDAGGGDPGGSTGGTGTGASDGSVGGTKTGGSAADTGGRTQSGGLGGLPAGGSAGLGRDGTQSGGSPSGGSGPGGAPAGGTSSGGMSGGGIGAGGSSSGGAVGDEMGGREAAGAGGEGTGGSGTGGAGGASTGGEPPVGEPTLVTSGADAHWQEGNATETTGEALVTVDLNRRFQEWDGWGGTFNEKGWEQLLLLSQSERDHALRLLFGKGDGCNLTYGRIPIGASDYALERYTLDESPGDYAMEHFSIERDRHYLIPYVKAALAVKPDLRLWASPWTPPTWMKDNGSFDRGNMKNDAQTLDAHALYLAKFVEAYAGEEIHIEAVHPQNEPGYPQDYPSCAWGVQTYLTAIVDHIGPLFEERLPDVEIWLGTLSNPDSTAFVEAVMSSPAASDYIRGISLQWNMGVNAPQYATQYGLPIMQSEHQCGNYPWNPVGSPSYVPTAPNDYAYAVESWRLIKEWLERGVNSYLAWNMVLDSVGLSLDTERPWAQNALLIVEDGHLNATPFYGVFRHLAAFVEPGATRVGVTGDADALAFENVDGSVVAVFYNADAERQMSVGIGDSTLEFTIPAHGWATVNWPRQ